ncbi:hypothetical protein DUNSADRAFT_10662 [Dunaliella salina]|uniref:CBS domain-containing protein n=1 Tax=Dunaliella salina TaxID=3046 RepID=A0ABQ7GEV8_DUNSA|nr:hypothetical protein DUNSADRAFT_10662 [Dunaliella salina]|eukprot:KAF5833143.1 hypothetical protein DUNSADRAFT_10662 [Dunaliella salina]
MITVELQCTHPLHTRFTPKLGIPAANARNFSFFSVQCLRERHCFLPLESLPSRRQQHPCATSKELLDEARQLTTIGQQSLPHTIGNGVFSSSSGTQTRPEEEKAPAANSQECEFGGVAKVMRPYGKGLIKCTPGDTLEGIIPCLTQITGMPVVNDARRVVGIITKKDVLRVHQAGGSLQQPVSEAMTSPALTVPITASVQEAADLMLDKEVHPLPVVDADGLLLGIIARSDIFKPIFKDQYLNFMNSNEAMVQGAQASMESEGKPLSWSIKYLYDGECSMCQSLKTLLERKDCGRGAVCFVNIADSTYDPSRHMGITYEEAMDTIHAIRSSGEVLKDTDALKALFNEVGLDWVVKLTELPIIAGLVNILYKDLSASRLNLGGAGDAVISALVHSLTLLPNFLPSFHGLGLLLFWKRAQCRRGAPCRSTDNAE